MNGIRMVAIVPAKGKELESFSTMLFDQLRAVKKESGISLVVATKSVRQMRADGTSLGESAFELTSSSQVPGDFMHACGMLISKLAKEMEVNDIRVDFYNTTYDIT